MLSEGNNISIESIIENANITTYFQPIISIKKKSIVGLEALSRGIFVGNIIPWFNILSLASDKNLVVELDRLCLETALENFKPIYPENRDFNFCLNIASFDVVDSVQFLDLVKKFNLSPHKIVIEHKEFSITDVEAFNKSIKPFRDFGFLIALDNVGEETPNLDRISTIKPDIVKIDKSLIRDINKENSKQEIVKSLVNLSNRINSVVVAEGLETEEEIIQTFKLGIDMLQGFYFARPQKITADIKKSVTDKIDHIAAKSKNL